MMQKQKLFFMVLLLPMVLLAAEESGTVNYSGRRISPEAGVFTVIGVKIEADEGDFLLVSVYFTDMVDARSVQNRRIFVDEKSLPPVTQFRFSKNRRGCQFKIKRPDSASFSLRFVQFQSYNGRSMNPIELHGLEENSFLKFSREARTWQKSSL